MAKRSTPPTKSRNAPKGTKAQMVAAPEGSNPTPSQTPSPDKFPITHKSPPTDPRLPDKSAKNKGRVGTKQRGKINLPSSLDVWSENPSHMPLPRGDFPSAVTPYRVWMHKLIRFNPIRQINPEEVTRQLDMWQAGTLRYFALMMDAVAKRDDVLQSVIPKRTEALARREWSIEVDPDADPEEAAKHQAVLKYFYDNLLCTHAVDMNMKRWVRLLIQLVLSARFFKYSTFEIMWKPTDDEIEMSYTDPSTKETTDLGTAPGLTAVLNYVPTWFFENRTGKLRFLQEDFSYDGVDLDDGAWMVAVGEGNMEAGVVAYMYKKMAIQEWMTYMQRQATPGLAGKVNASPDSDRWAAMVKAVEDFAAGFGMVINTEDSLEPVNVSATGQLPYPQAVERMDRVLATLMRGQDLSTMSAHHTSGSQGGGQGASLQGSEEHIVETGDGNFVNETLNLNLDTKVIEYHFGEGTKPLAKFCVNVPEEKDIAGIMDTIEFVVGSGGQVGMRWAMQKLGVAECAEDDEPLLPLGVTAQLQTPDIEDDTAGQVPNEGRAKRALLKLRLQRYRQRVNESRVDDPANKALIKKSDELFAAATYQALKPLVDRVLGVMELPDEAQDFGLHRLREDLPAITRQINADPKSAEILKNAMTAGWFNSIISSEVEQHTRTQTQGVNT